MCQFNFIILENKIREIAHSSNLNLIPIKLNISDSNLHSYLTCKKDCDCGSLIGSDNWKEIGNLDVEKERKKLERKRFSANRIEQLLIQKKENFDFKNLEKEKSELYESENWTKFINTIKSSKMENRLGVLFHNFSGKLEDENIKLKEINLNEISKRSLQSMNDGEINWVNIK